MHCHAKAAPAAQCRPFSANHVQLGVQVTRLQVCIHCQGVPTAQYKETTMAVLACIIVACSARLGALDLRLDWYCREACAENLLVRLLRLTPHQSRLCPFTRVSACSQNL